MDNLGRIRSLLAANDPNLRLVHENTCWVDSGVRCPYGAPQGQYQLRPEKFCNSSCQHFRNGDITLYDRNELSDYGIDAVERCFHDHAVSLSSEFYARANDLPEGSVERLVLEWAAEIIERRGLDRKILLNEDLPK